MSRLLVFLALSLALHIFAVFPLLAEQFAGDLHVADGLPERAVLAVPSLVIQPAAVESAAQALVEPLAASVAPVELKSVAAAQLPETRAVRKAKAVVKADLVPQVVEKSVLELKAAASSRMVRAAVTERTSYEPLETAEAVAPPAAKPKRSTPSTPSTQEVISAEPRFARPPTAPVYPAQARRRQQQGTVWVEVRLDARGQQVELQVLRSSRVPSLDQAALAAVKKWQFLPEAHNGVGVPSRVQIPIEFAIKAKL